MTPKPLDSKNKLLDLVKSIQAQSSAVKRISEEIKADIEAQEDTSYHTIEAQAEEALRKSLNLPQERKD